MYSKRFPYKGFDGRPHNETVTFNLTQHEVIKNMVEFQVLTRWFDSVQGEERDLTTEEVLEFYDAFEKILLAAWGEMSEDGLHFRKSGRFDFEESALFPAVMEEFVTNPEETGKFIQALIPKELNDLVAKAEANLAKTADNTENLELKARIQELQRELSEKSEG